MFPRRLTSDGASKSTASALSSDDGDEEVLVSSEIADGELLTLVQSLDETSPADTALPDESDDWYGHPLSVSQALEAMSASNQTDEEGQVWKALVIPDKYFDMANGKVVLRRGLNAKDFDISSGRIKPRRATLPLTQTSLRSSLTTLPPTSPSSSPTRYIFHGVLNGWPGLRTLELVALEVKRDTLPGPQDLVRGRIKWSPVWNVNGENDANSDKAPTTVMDPARIYRATLRAAPWSARGWSSYSPGYCFWFEAQTDTGPRVLYGTALTREVSDSTCMHVHMMSHRYARRHETPRDRITYHSVCLLEWDHGRYTTVVESAYLNGMGGYKGRSNWYDDRDEETTALYQNLPPEMIAPWRTNSAEIRCYDIPCKNHEEFQSFVRKHAGHDKRFIDPQFHFSHPARLSFRSKHHIAQYLINYISRDTSYAELKRNCQTFCADLCSFLAGKKGIVPFHPVARVEYNNRTYLFLYDSGMYESRQAKKAKSKQTAATRSSS